MSSGFLNALWIVPILGVLILVHELGHFFAARLVGIRVEEFGMGLPPRLAGYKAKSGVLYSLNWIPFGGFVKMYGQDDLRPDGGVAYGSDSFVSKSPAQRALVLVAGVLMNLLLAIVIFSLIALGQGRREAGALIFIDEVAPGSPAAVAGLRVGDRITAAAGQEIVSSETLRTLIDQYAGRPLPLVVERDGERLNLTVTPRRDGEIPEGQGRVGVALAPRAVFAPISFWEAPIEGVRSTGNTLVLMVDGLRRMLTGQISPGEIAGPIGMGQATSEIVEESARTSTPLWVTLGNLTAFLSVNLFLVNLLPLPALDGGRLVFVVLEMLRGGRKVAPEREGMVHFVGLVMLLALMFVIAFGDIARLFRGDSFIP